MGIQQNGRPLDYHLTSLRTGRRSEKAFGYVAQFHDGIVRSHSTDYEKTHVLRTRTSSYEGWISLHPSESREKYKGRRWWPMVADQPHVPGWIKVHKNGGYNSFYWCGNLETALKMAVKKKQECIEDQVARYLKKPEWCPEIVWNDEKANLLVPYYDVVEVVELLECWGNRHDQQQLTDQGIILDINKKQILTTQILTIEENNGNEL